MAKNDFRVTFILKIIIRICMKNVEFCRKTSKFLPKRCLFMFCIFYLNEKKLNQQICRKYICNTFRVLKVRFLTLPLTQKKRKQEQKHNPTPKTSKTSEKFSLVTLVTNYHKLSLLPLVVGPWRKFEKQKLRLNFESCNCYFKLVIFS